MNAIVVCGPPLAGKTTYAEKLGVPYVDWDNIYAELSGLPLHQRAPNDSAIKGQTHERFRVECMTALRTGGVVVRCAPSRWERDMYRLTRGVQVVLLEVPYEECMRRLEASGRSSTVIESTRMAIRQWWATYRPSPDDVLIPWHQEIAA